MAWRTLTSSPIKGDAVLVEIYGADLFVKGDDNSANLKFESWWKGKPDCYVKFRHGKQRGQTQVEGNTFSPRFYETRKLKYQKGEGFEFQVWESDIIGSDRIVGRCWVSAEKAKKAMKHDTPVLAKLGAGPRGTRISHQLDRVASAQARASAGSRSSSRARSRSRTARRTSWVQTRRRRASS